MRKQQIAIITFAMWLITIISVFLLLSLQLDLEIFFILSIIGLFVIMLLMEPKFVQPGYLRYIRYLMAGGTVLFAVIVVQKVTGMFAQ
jgi:hypothetical protein